MSPTISAQVAMRGDANTELDAVVTAFADAGFQVGPAVANNFSIAGPAELFARYFQVNVDPAQLPDTLPLSALPADVRSRIQAVVFTRGYGPFP